MQNILDSFPVATVTFLAGLALIIVGYLSHDVGFSEAFKDVLFVGGGSGAIGYVRNQAGHGIRRK